jgi:hypothetical protein
MSAIPGTLFKYEGLNTYSLQNLKAQSVYFGSPLKFNDPYDCAITARYADPTPSDLDAIRAHLKKLEAIPRKSKSVLATLSDYEILTRAKKMAVKATEQMRERFAKTKGITCFSEVNDDLLMWSHYGGRYEGFCLEFSTKDPMFEKIRQVNYTDTMPEFSLYGQMTRKQVEDIIKLFTTKSPVWRHEREWRAIHNQVGTSFVYKADSLKAVYFGPHIQREALEIICLILAGQNPAVDVWQGKRSTTQFKVEFEKSSYTPYILAKSRGWVS